MIKPLGEYILIKPDSAETKLPSGIILPEQQSDTPQSGTLIDGGSGTLMTNLQIGMKIWFKMWAGEKIRYKETDYLLVHRKDLIAYE